LNIKFIENGLILHEINDDKFTGSRHCDFNHIQSSLDQFQGFFSIQKDLKHSLDGFNLKSWKNLEVIDPDFAFSS
jgi:hypothetical protein